MKKINFLFAIHCHQPVGNFEHVIEDAYYKSYLPFISVLEKYPSIKATVHYTGILFSWFMEKHPEFIEKLSSLVKKGQIEILTGAYYEPILSIIPEKDRIGQIEKQTKFIKKHFGVVPKGAWLAERIWEPSLPKTFHDAKVKYTILDDYHFISAGLDYKNLNGYYVTEDQGYKVAVFPINKNLRYLIPFKLPHETIDYLRMLSTEESADAAILADDGEKFGVWPGTFKWVYEERYLDNLFSMLSNESHWINTITYSEYLDKFAPKGRIYLPTGSYFEMMEWSLLTEAGKEFFYISTELKSSGKFERYKKFFKGGFWRNFFVKYPESNNMHKKMLHVSKKVWQCAEKLDIKEHQMLDELWMGQCNCAYWHGVFGGLYLNYLRHAVYEHLINAEKIADSFRHSEKKWIDVDVFDFDKDGFDEIIVNTDLLNLYFDPDCGGALFELDYKPKSFNLTNNLARREEIYHKDVLRSQSHQMTLTGTTNGASSIHDIVRVKEKGLEKLLFYDKGRKNCFVEHFLDGNTNINNFSSANYSDLGDFSSGNYSFNVIYGTDNVQVIMEREGYVACPSGREMIKIVKNFTIYSNSNEIIAKWDVYNLSVNNIDLFFGIENNFSLLAGNSPDRYYEIDGKIPEQSNLSSFGETLNIYEAKIIDKWSNISIIIDTSPRCDLWRFPIETVSQSEGGFERTFQNSSLLIRWKSHIEPGKKNSYSLKLSIRS